MPFPNPVGGLLTGVPFVGLPALLLGRLVLAMVDRAVAAPVLAVVFADSIIFLKNPLFLAFGASRPPRRPAGPVLQSGAVT